MNIAVCAKAVPAQSILSLAPGTGHIDHDDLAAVEQAVRIKENCGGSHITLVRELPLLLIF